MTAPRGKGGLQVPLDERIERTKSSRKERK